MIIVLFTLLTAPVDVAANAPATFQPIASFEVEGRTEKNAMANCNRFAKAAQSAGMFGTCVPKSEASKG